MKGLTRIQLIKRKSVSNISIVNQEEGLFMTYYAFFDLDETIIRAKSMLAVIEEYYLSESIIKPLGKIKFKRFLKRLARFNKKYQDRVALNKFYYQLLAGIESQKIYMASKKWFARNSKKLFNMDVLNEIERHKAKGAKIIVVTGSFFECIKPITDYLNLQNVICAHPEQARFRYTGRLLNEPTIGYGKETAILAHVNKYNLSLEGSYAYADDDSDIPMLALTSNPVVVGSNHILLQHAKARGWKIIN